MERLLDEDGITVGLRTSLNQLQHEYTTSIPLFNWAADGLQESGLVWSQEVAIPGPISDLHFKAVHSQLCLLLSRQKGAWCPRPSECVGLSLAASRPLPRLQASSSEYYLRGLLRKSNQETFNGNIWALHTVLLNGPVGGTQILLWEQAPSSGVFVF